MLTPEELQYCSDDIILMYQHLNETIVRDIVRRINKTNILTETAELQTIRLQNSGKLYDDIIKDISKHTKKSERTVRNTLINAGIKSTNYDTKAFAEAGIKDFALSPAAYNVLEAGIRKTNSYLANLTRTTAIEAQKIFINASRLAEMKVERGAFDYISAVKNAVKSVIESGAKTVSYATGHVDKIDVAVRRAVLTGVTQTVSELSMQNATDMGCDLMELSAHFGARPSHEEWQGKIVSLSGKPGYLSLSDIGYGTGDGFAGWNCRHSWYPFFEGISQRAYSDEKLKEYRNKTVTYNEKEMSYYDATQKQRAMERQIRKDRLELVGYDEAMKTNDAELSAEFKKKFDSASVKLKSHESTYKEFAKQTNLPTQNQRLQLYGFNKSVSQKAVHSAKKSKIV